MLEFREQLNDVGVEPFEILKREYFSLGVFNLVCDDFEEIRVLK